MRRQWAAPEARATVEEAEQALPTDLQALLIDSVLMLTDLLFATDPSTEQSVTVSGAMATVEKPRLLVQPTGSAAEQAWPTLLTDLLFSWAIAIQLGQSIQMLMCNIQVCSCKFVDPACDAVWVLGTEVANCNQSWWTHAAAMHQHTLPALPAQHRCSCTTQQQVSQPTGRCHGHSCAQ
jgi:hypothetical protein